MKITQSNPTFAKLLETIGKVTSGIAAVIGFFGLLSWVFNFWPITSLGSQFSPVSPASMVMLILLTLLVFSELSHPSKPPLKTAKILIVASIAVFSLLALIEVLTRIRLTSFDLFMPSGATSGVVPVSRISPISAALLMVLAISFLLLLLSKKPNGTPHIIAAMGGLIVAAICLVILLTYAAGVPIGFSGIIKPTAILTAIGVWLLALSLVALAGGEIWPSSLKFFGRSVHDPSPDLAFELIPVTAGLVVLISLFGFLVMRSQAIEGKRSLQVSLTNIAAIKVNQIGDWYYERMADANFIVEGIPGFVLDQFFDNDGADQPSRNDLQNMVNSLRNQYQLQAVVIYDASGRVKLSAVGGEIPDHVAEMIDFQRALLSKKPVVSDMHRYPELSSDNDRNIRIDFWVPLRLAPEPGLPAKGVLLLQVDPAQYLFPLIQSWPMASESGETVMVRREFDEVQFLNNLRFMSDAALNLRMSIPDHPNLPAVMAATGVEGIVEGMDYRNVPVIADLHNIPDTPWFLLVKMDLQEAYAPLEGSILASSIVILFLLLVTGLGMLMVSRQRDNQWLAARLASEKERQALAERILQLNKQANDIILLMDKDWKVLEANDRAVSTYGYSFDELKGLHAYQLRSDNSTNLDELAAKLEVQNGLIFETTHRRKDGSTFPVENSILCVEIGGISYYQEIIRDITERKQAEDALHWHNSYLSALQETTLELVSKPNLDELLENIVRRVSRLIAADSGFLDLVDDAAGALTTKVSQGVMAQLLRFSSAAGEGVSGVVWKTRRPLVVNDYDAWPERNPHVNPNIILAVIGVPLLSSLQTNEPKVLGVLGLAYTPSSGRTFSEDTIEPLTQFARLASLAIDNAHLYEKAQIELNERLTVEKALRASEEKYRTLFVHMSEGMALHELVLDEAGAPCDYILLDVNPAFEKIIHLKRSEVAGRFASQVYGLTPPPYLEEYAKVALSRQTYYFETYFAPLDMHFAISVISPAPNRFATIFSDITERIKHVEEIQRFNAELEQRVHERTAELEVSNKELEAFAYSVSHDLRSPLRSIDGFIEACLEDYGEKIDPQGKTYLNRARAASQRMGTLIEDLLNLSRVTRSEMKRVPVDLSSLANKLAAEFQETKPQRKVEWKIAPGLTTTGDATLLEVVLRNLFDNAWKFTSRHPTAHIEFNHTLRDGDETFYVRDDGAGFNMAYSDKLFGVFRRLHNIEDFSGTGIGLATVQRIIQRHGGKVWAEGMVEHGATFYFWLPPVKYDLTDESRLNDKNRY